MVHLASNSADRISWDYAKNQVCRGDFRCLGRQFTLIEVLFSMVIVEANSRQILLQIIPNSLNKAERTRCWRVAPISPSCFQRTPISNSFVLTTNGWATNTAKVAQMNLPAQSHRLPEQPGK